MDNREVLMYRAKAGIKNSKPELLVEGFPVTIVQARYGRTYSGGEWLAVANSDGQIDISNFHVISRIEYIMDDGPGGGDTDAMEFWADPPDWIAVGNTPGEALKALEKKYGA